MAVQLAFSDFRATIRSGQSLDAGVSGGTATSKLHSQKILLRLVVVTQSPAFADQLLKAAYSVRPICGCVNKSALVHTNDMAGLPRDFWRQHQYSGNVLSSDNGR